VAYPPGGTNDIVARPIGQKLSELLGQPVVIDNRGGASGNIGTEAVAKAQPDGYVLLMAAGAVTIAPSIFPSLPYDIVRDFTPISLAARGGFVLLVHPAVPARTVKEFIALAKSRPGALNYASSGAGAPPYLATVLFETMTGARLTHVPYKGGTQPLTDLVAGQVDSYFGGIASAQPFIQSGRIRAIAVTTKKRWELMPELPTLDEGGLKGFDIATFFGLMAPAGTPDDIVAKLNAAMVKAVATPSVRKTMLTAGVAPESSTPEQFAHLVRDEIRRFASIVKSAGAKND
jgi:tripartite-type tricarboxylate transporter receptor subunit TctC